MAPSVCFVPPDRSGTGHYRCILIAEHLKRQGWKVGFPVLHRKENPDPDALIKVTDRLDNDWYWAERANPQADVYVIASPEANTNTWLQFTKEVRSKGKVVVCDADDNTLRLPSWHPAWMPNVSQAYQFRFSCYRAADHLTVSTPFLADDYRQFNTNVTLLRNRLEWSMWDKVTPQYEVKRDRVRVGWLGHGLWRSGDLDVLKPWLGPWLERNPHVDFVAAGDPRVHDELGIPAGQRVTPSDGLVQWPLLPGLVATMDVGLVPLELNDFNESKSCLKGMEYAACGIPCLASPTGEYQRWVEEGVNGFVCGDDDAWVQALERVVADHDLRARMGAAARARARENALDRHVGQWADLYTELAGRKSRPWWAAAA